MADAIDSVDHRIFQILFKIAEPLRTYNDAGFIQSWKQIENIKLYVSYSKTDRIYEAFIYGPKSFRITLRFRQRVYESSTDLVNNRGFLDVGGMIMPYWKNEYTIDIKKYKYYNDERFLEFITKVMLTHA
jgi:hypothetical protein